MKRRRRKELRRGFTTGACAAAAAKAAVILLLSSEFRVKGSEKIKEVEIPFPDKSRVTFKVHNSGLITCNSRLIARASVIKDAGDDPDVTNGAEICAEVCTSASSKFKVQNSKFGKTKAFQFTVHGSCLPNRQARFTVFGGEGVGIVTKPGLAVPVGEPAINPVPRKIIENSIREVLKQFTVHGSRFTVVISVTKGKAIAKKTMNARLGIIGGISILGTTGIVEPMSVDAYKESISCAIDVALASGCKEVVFSTGRSSEKGAQRVLGLPEESFILVGDHMGYALKEARGKREGAGQKDSSRSTVHSSLKKITVVGQFGKFSKMAAGYFETHCKDSSVELEFLAGLAKDAGAEEEVLNKIKRANTAREVFSILQENRLKKVFEMVCEKVKRNAEKVEDRNFEIGCMLVGYNNEIVERT